MTRITCITALAAAVALTAPVAPVAAQDAAPPTVAVMPFLEAGVAGAAAGGVRPFEGIGKAIADFLTTSLTANEKLRVVPREVAQRALDAQRPAGGAADRESARRAARAAGARFVIVGGYTMDGRGFLRVDGRGVDAESGEVLFTERVQGRGDQVVELAERLGTRISAGLQWPPGAAGSVGAPLTAQQAVLYGRALDHADRGERARAAESLETLLRDVPDFGPARRALARLKPSP